MANKKNYIIIFLFLAIITFLTLIYFYKSSKEISNIFCKTDMKLCADGSYVTRLPPLCNFASCPKEDIIVINEPQPYSIIKSPFLISGKAKGTWFFEGTFPIKLLDAQGKIVAQTYASTKDNWMSDDFINFEAQLTFNNPSSQSGFLIFEKNNPAGLSEKEDYLKMPINFYTNNINNKTKIKLYYYNPQLDKDENGNILCSEKGIVAVEREIPFSQTPIQDTIKLLLQGKLTREELKEGIKTEYPLEKFELKSASLKNGVLTLEFIDPLNKTSGGSCRTKILWEQIEKTAKQFENVKEVKFQPEYLFQP